MNRAMEGPGAPPTHICLVMSQLRRPKVPGESLGFSILLLRLLPFARKYRLRDRV